MAQKPKPSVSSDTQLPAGRYDIASKDVIQRNPEDWLQFGLGLPEATAIAVLETEQPTAKSNRADVFIEADVLGKVVIAHFEIQTHDSTQTPMPYRVAGYAGRGIESFQKEVWSHVIYLHPSAGRNDPGEYVQDTPGYEIHIRYKVIRLYDFAGQPVLDAKVKGLIPFAPLMKPPEEVNPEQWFARCVEAAKSVPLDESDKADYLADMGILAGLILDFPIVHKFISEETMYKSSVIQHFLQQGIEQGIEQGARESTIEGILEALEIQFRSSGAQTLKPLLESIEELQRLKDLRRAVLQVNSLDEFKTLLAS